MSGNLGDAFDLKHLLVRDLTGAGFKPAPTLAGDTDQATSFGRRQVVLDAPLFQFVHEGNPIGKAWQNREVPTGIHPE